MTSTSALHAGLHHALPQMARTFRDPWWIIGSAALALAGVPGIVPRDIDVLYSHNDDMTFGAIEVMREAGIEPGRDIAIISVDATQRSVDYLKAGVVNCVIECNPNSGNHHFTESWGERTILVSKGWRYEGVAWYANKNSSVPVYRLYNPHNGEHLYTTNYAEYQKVKAAGWSAEGIAWYA